MEFKTFSLVMQNFLPSELKVGMFFTRVVKNEIEVYSLDHVPNNMEEFLEKYFYPVKLFIIDEGNPNIDDVKVIASDEQIGWWDIGEHSEELSDITLKQINTILNKRDGCVSVQFEDGLLSLYHDKVILRDCEYELYDDDDEEEDESMCYACNGTGEGSTPEHACFVCGGSGMGTLDSDDFKEPDDDEYDTREADAKEWGGMDI